MNEISYNNRALYSNDFHCDASIQEDDGKNALFKELARDEKKSLLVLWGDIGAGKTTFLKLFARDSNDRLMIYLSLSSLIDFRYNKILSEWKIEDDQLWIPFIYYSAVALESLRECRSVDKNKWIDTITQNKICLLCDDLDKLDDRYFEAVGSGKYGIISSLRNLPFNEYNVSGPLFT